MSDFRVPQRPLGSQGLMASAQGLGTMGMTAFYASDPVADEPECLRTIDRALELGINLFDTAWIYQDFRTGATSEELLGKAIAKHGRDKFIVTTKFGIVPGGDTFKSDSSPASSTSPPCPALHAVTERGDKIPANAVAVAATESTPGRGPKLWSAVPQMCPIWSSLMATNVSASEKTATTGDASVGALAEMSVGTLAAPAASSPHATTRPSTVRAAIAFTTTPDGAS